MGKYCEVCNKGLMNGNRVSHAENKTGRMYAPNVQRVRVLVDGPSYAPECVHSLPAQRQGCPRAAQRQRKRRGLIIVPQ